MELIRNDVVALELINYHLLIPFQGELKELSDENYKRLKQNIIQYGFSEAIGVWKDEKNTPYILNGHQRLRTLIRMEAEGFQIPEIPILIIRAKDREEASMKLLSLTSQFGVMTQKGLYDYIKTNNIQIDKVVQNFKFPEINLKKFNIEFFGGNQEEANKAPPDTTPQSIVIITCKDEYEMRMLYDEMTTRGYECKLIT